MKTSHFRRLLSACLAFALVTTAGGFSTLPSRWTRGASFTMQIGFGPTTIPLQDGMASWDASASDAFDIWHGYLDFITASSVTSPTVPQSSGDGINSAFFSSTIFGDSFEEGTLAVTVVLGVDGDTSKTAEADVIVNTALDFDSYRGPQQPVSYDFHRIMVHEFGHVFGLGHVTNDPPGQAIMEPIISDMDHPGPDDIGGIKGLYGAIIANVPPQFLLRVGDSFLFPIDFLLPFNDPTSFTVIGLPPGITYDPATSLISGSATTSGLYDSLVIAHGPFADAYAALRFNVQSLDRVRGLQRILPVNGSRMIADPGRPRIYTASRESIKMIDTETFAVTTLAPATGEDVTVAALSVSADGSELWSTDQYQSPPLLNRIDLESLALLPAIPIPGNASAALEGLEDRAYVADRDGIYQFNRQTGALQLFFAPTGGAGFPEIALSPDRSTLFVAERVLNAPADAYLFVYDVSGPEPILRQSIEGAYKLPIPSPDGQFLYYSLYDAEGENGHLVQAALPDLSSATPFVDLRYETPTVAIAPDGTIYESDLLEGPTPPTFSLYNPATLKRTFEIDPNHFLSDYPSPPITAVFERTGKYLFVGMFGLTPEVWVFSTDFAAYPEPPPNPTRNLLNISTRLRVEAGENAMIGGFIVQGQAAKKVLIRGLGPSLPLTGALSNPVLDLYDSSGALIATNDDWIAEQNTIFATALPPTSEREAAILATLLPGAYTAVVRDRDGQPGLALVEAYDLDPYSSVLANISTRGKVQEGDNVLIGGFIIGGEDFTSILVRAIGPSLSAQGVTQPLADPVLEVHNEYGQIVATNDDWRSTQQSEIIATGLAPADDKESAALITLYSGSYTAIIRGQVSTTGVALVEVYNLDSAATASK